MGRLIMLRHGQSIYNQKKIFTGWSDVELSKKGVAEAKNAGKLLKTYAILPDICFSSWLKRAIHTACLALHEMEWEHIDCIKSWKLNERHYGAWQQRKKDEIRAEVGDEIFFAIRRGYETPPPLLEENDSRLPQNDPKYRSLDPSILPRGESLKETRHRTLQYFYEAIAPMLARDKTVLLSAHGNSLRALTMAIEHLTPKQTASLEIPSAVPIIYRLNDNLEILEKSVLT